KNGLKYKEYEEGVFQADFSKLLVSNTEMMLNAIENNRIDIVTHVGDKGPFDVVDISKACAKKGVMMEINSHHSHLNVEELKIAAREDVRFVLSSDAHRAEDVGEVTKALEIALDAGIDLERIDNLERK
ncbi:MAG: histidinol-phosphatase, partial [Clostridia bacterium]|nr:histidinol-phosphatase [Clostridia bacterium]